MLYSICLWILDVYCEMLYNLKKFMTTAKGWYLRTLYKAMKMSFVHVNDYYEYYVFTKKCPRGNAHTNLEDKVYCETPYVHFRLQPTNRDLLKCMSEKYRCGIYRALLSCPCGEDRRFVVYNGEMKKMAECEI